MAFDQKPGAKSVGARFVGLGLSTAVVLTICGTLPVTALAEEDTSSADTVTLEQTAPQVVEAEAQTTQVAAPVIKVEAATTAPNVLEVTDSSTVQASTKPAEDVSVSQASNNEQSVATSSDQAVTTEGSGQETPEKDTSISTAGEQDGGAVNEKVTQSTSSVRTTTSRSKKSSAAKKASSTSDTTTDATTGEDSDTSASSGTSTGSVTSTASDATTVVPVDEQSGESDDSGLDTEATATEGEADSTVSNATVVEITYSNMYRLYNPYNGEHLYTSDLEEVKTDVSVGWRYENVAWVAPSQGIAVYRLFNPYATVGTHLYTIAADERDGLTKLGWLYEGIGWYGDDTGNGIAVLREYNPYSGEHHYTTSQDESDNLTSIGWRYEGVGWYASNHATLPLEQGFWVTTNAGGSTWRYWIASNAEVAYNRRVDPSANTIDQGAGFVAYATNQNGGAVVRGSWDNGGGYVYIGDNDGRLIQFSDGAFHDLDLNMGDGTQSYYFDTNGSGRSGFFYIGDSRYYAVPDKGYILKNQSGITIDGKQYDIDGAGLVSEVTLPANIQAALNYANQITLQYGMYRDLFITVSHNTHTFYMWQGSAGNLSYLWSCSCTMGKPSTPSYYGYNYLNDPQVDFSGAKYAIKYAGHEAGDGWHIHSTLLYTSAESQLGRDLSNGCIRIPIDRAKWLYDKVVGGYGGWGWTVGINIYVY